MTFWIWCLFFRYVNLIVCEFSKMETQIFGYFDSPLRNFCDECVRNTLLVFCSTVLLLYCFISSHPPVNDFSGRFSLHCMQMNAPRSVKVMYAFKVYDFNEDGVICQKDVSNIVQTLCGQRKWGKGELKTIVDNFFKETDMDSNQELDFGEFENMITKAPDFLSSFRFRPIS